MKKRIATLLLAALLMTGCAGQDPEVPDESLPGGVFVIALNEKYDGYGHRAYGRAGDRVSEENRVSPEDVAGELTSVFFSDDLMLYIKGETAKEATYSLYDIGYDALYEGSEEFSAPVYGGVYYLCVDVEWGDEERSEGYQYFFKFQR